MTVYLYGDGAYLSFNSSQLKPYDMVMPEAYVEKRVDLTYSASIAVNAGLGNQFVIDATNGSAFTINNPTNPIDGQKISVIIRNSSGGLLGQVSWGNAFTLSNSLMPIEDGKEDAIVFEYDSSESAWFEISRTRAQHLRFEKLSGVYNFADDGGAQSSIVLAHVPDNSIIIRGWYEVLTALTSGGSATVSFGVAVDDAFGLLGATAYNNAAFSTGSLHDFIPDGIGVNATTKSSSLRNVIMTIGTADLTAGKIRVWCEYIVSE